MNNLPAMTEEQRQELIQHATEEIRLKTGHIARLEKHMPGQFNTSRYQMDVLTAKIALAALTSPPAPVLRAPDELKVKNGSHQSHIDYAEGWADCIDEVKRLNTQPSPPEASNDQ
ncbi:hypothetical protein [Pantoea sp. GM_Pan_4]|uniref:hypothetical protein n=1 Tax=Pantoea sp. GM_Pan_4 TaxID=2937389 RepID=UPI00226AF2DC|nr:hypothetical protein [Pantoea sp. GM_Pan_4]